MAFGIGPVLTMAAIEALAAHGTDDAEADLSAEARSPANGWARCSSPSRRPAPTSARCAPRPSARPTAPIASPGQKIFITYGEHDLTDNIIHFVLARLPDAPPGTKGISLFLVPKFLLDDDGTLGARNDVRAHSIEHKMGIHALADLHHGLRRRRRRGRLSDRRGACRHGLHVHHDERGAARGRAAGRRHRRARDAAGAGLCARAQAGPRAGDERHRVADHRASGRAAHADDHARADARRARHLLRHRHRARPRASRQGRRGAQGRATSAPRCSRRSRKPSRPISASRSPRSACRCMAAWASSRRPAPRSIIATRASPRSTKAPTASRRSISSRASCR